MRYREPLDVFVLAKVAQVISKHFDSTKLEFQKSKKSDTISVLFEALMPPHCGGFFMQLPNLI
jgi:hypothetical protein